MRLASSPGVRAGGYCLAALGICIILAVSGCRPAPRTFRIGVICGGDSFSSAVDGFKEAMTARGYVEGRNVAYVTRLLRADRPAIHAAAVELVALNVDLLFAVPTEPALSAKTAARGTKIPVIFAYAGLEGTDLVQSVRFPGDNITGVRYPGVDLIAKRFELLREAVPGLRRLLVCFDPSYPNIPPTLAAVRSLAAASGVALVEVPVTGVDRMAPALAALPPRRVDGMMLMPDLLNTSPEGWKAIREFASRMNIPIAGSQLFTVEQGAILGNAADLRETGADAAELADKVLKGARAGTLPVISPEYDLWINPGRMRELGLAVPPGMLKMATKVVRSPGQP